MSKNNENIFVPKFRFPEFIKDKGWKEKELGSIGEFKNGVNFSPDKKGSGYLTVDVLNMYGLAIETNLESLYRIDIEAKESILEENDLLFVRSSLKREGVGWVSLFPNSPEPVLFCGFLIRMRLNSLQEYNARYLAYYLRSDIGRKKIISLSGTAAITNISQDSLKQIKAPFPAIPKEQQKIADCLSSLDEIIKAESQKLDLLNDFKKGLLQKLLPLNSETSPEFRFSQFEEIGDWEETTLTQVADYENGKAHEKDIEDNGDFIVVNSKFISTDGEVKKFTNTAFCPAKKGDILMVLSDVPNGKAISKCFLVEEDDHYTVNQRICKLTPRNLNSKILYYLLNRNPYFLSFDDGVKQTNLRKDDVLNCPLLIPSELKEQEKIANTLSSIDDLINAQIQKIEALNLHKKGLLQGLFPTISNEE